MSNIRFIGGTVSKSTSLNIRMVAVENKRDKVMEKVILNLGWEWYAASKACEYSRKIIKGRWKEAEEIIKKIPYQCYLYARHVLKSRWKEVEPIIAKDSNAAYLYAKFVLKERFELAEKKFKSPREIYLYAKYVLKTRWKEKESDIVKHLKKNPSWYLDDAVKYAVFLRKNRWPDIEESVLSSRNIGQYYKILKNESDKEDFFNKALAQSLVEPKSKWIPNYAMDFIKSCRMSDSKNTNENTTII